MAWDYYAALQILHHHNSQHEDDHCSVVAAMCGHDHSGIVLPFGKEGERLDVVMKKMDIQYGKEEDVKEEEEKES
eukprot:10067289-Ditylum_brightwellii.AAC.1